MFELISAYIDGECSLKEQKLVEAYLAENPQASKLLEELSAIKVLWGQAKVYPPTSLREAILSSTIRRSASRRSTGIPLRLAWAFSTFILICASWYSYQVWNATEGEKALSPPLSAPFLSQRTPPPPAPASITPPSSPHMSPQQSIKRTQSPPRRLRGTLQALPTEFPHVPSRVHSVPSSTAKPFAQGTPMSPIPAEQIAKIAPPPSKPAPEVPDLVALNSEGGLSPQEEVGAPLEGSTASSPDNLSPEARSRLRKRLSEVNSTKDELREAVKGGSARRS